MSRLGCHPRGNRRREEPRGTVEPSASLLPGALSQGSPEHKSREGLWWGPLLPLCGGEPKVTQLPFGLFCLPHLFLLFPCALCYCLCKLFSPSVKETHGTGVFYLLDTIEFQDSPHVLGKCFWIWPLKMVCNRYNVLSRVQGCHNLLREHTGAQAMACVSPLWAFSCSSIHQPPT